MTINVGDAGGGEEFPAIMEEEEERIESDAGDNERVNNIPDLTSCIMPCSKVENRI